jgi:outer membrane protein assembly factor BamB
MSQSTGVPSALAAAMIYETVANGVVYVGSYDYHLYAFNAATGQPLWSADTGGFINSSPAVADGMVYVGSDGSVCAFNAETGQLVWSFPVDSPIFSSPAVANGVVYVGTMSVNIYALNATSGETTLDRRGGGQSSPTVANGVVYAASNRDSHRAGTRPTEQCCGARPQAAM